MQFSVIPRNILCGLAYSPLRDTIMYSKTCPHNESFEDYRPQKTFKEGRDVQRMKYCDDKNSQDVDISLKLSASNKISHR